MSDLSPRLTARIAGFFYLADVRHRRTRDDGAERKLATNLGATACYVAVTLLFYVLFAPVDRALYVSRHWSNWLAAPSARMGRSSVRRPTVSCSSVSIAC